MFGSSFTGTSLHLSTPASLILAFVASTYLQSSTTLQARTLDPNGADFRDAKIGLSSGENGLERIAQTPEEDIYQFAALPVGSSLSPFLTPANQSGTPKRILVLYWYNKDYPWNVKFDQRFQEALRAASAGAVEYYPEYLESNRFPGENQSLLLRDYMRQKYADRSIDALIASSDTSLDFLIKHRSELFPRTPIVFVATRHPTEEELRAPPGLTGIINISTYAETLDLALKLHPDTEQLFVISGTLQHDKKFEALAREDLRGFEKKLRINYLTDMGPDELVAKTKILPEHSIILFVWQQALNEQGKILESADVLGLVAQSAPVPIYGMATPYIGNGIVGGHINTAEASATRLAEISLRIADGESAKTIPVETAPTVPMFDWRQLRRWGLSEDALPQGSIVQFRESSFWDLYRWRIVAIVSLLLVETLLIAGLLIQRSRRARAEASRRLSETNLRKLTGRLIHLQDEERRRIAAELHDGLGQSLAIIRNRATICQRETSLADRVSEQLAEISATADSAIEEVREIAHNLRPFELDRLGLVHAVESIISKVSASSSIPLSSDLDPLDGLLSPEAETSVYRIVQEGLNNVIKHAAATQGRVTLKQVGGQLIVTIADNGKGIGSHANNQDGHGHGFGLAGIAERARMLGGSCVIDSEPGRGTTLKVSVGLSEVGNGR